VIEHMGNAVFHFEHKREHKEIAQTQPSTNLLGITMNEINTLNVKLVHIT